MNATQYALGRMMTFRLGFCEIIKPRKYCRAGPERRRLQAGLGLHSTGCDTMRVDAFLREPGSLTVEISQKFIAR
jgi:hypothetical protein